MKPEQITFRIPSLNSRLPIRQPWVEAAKLQANCLVVPTASGYEFESDRTLILTVEKGTMTDLFRARFTREGVEFEVFDVQQSTTNSPTDFGFQIRAKELVVK